MNRLMIASVLALFSGTTHALDLVSAYEKALRYDPAMLAAGEAVIAGREKAVQGDALLRPQVNLTAGYSHVEEKSKTDLPPALADIIKSEGSGNVRQAKVELRQPIYDARAAADRKQLHSRTDLAELSFRNARQDLMQKVSEAYLNVLLAQENMRVVEAEKAAVGMQRDRAQARFEVGRGRITEVQETQARYDSVLTREVSARSTLALRQAQFQELTGVPAEGLAVLRPGFRPVPPQPNDLQAWQQKSRDHNSRVQTKQSELAIATAEINKHRLSGRPTLDLVASYGYKGQDGGLSPISSPDGSRQAVIGMQLTIPLFAGGALDSRERESIAKRREAEHDLAAAKRDARLQVQDAYLAVITGVSRIASLEQSVLSAQTALEATTLGRDVGSRTDLDVLDAQQRLFSSQIDLAQARNDYLQGRIRLASAAGELGEPDLQALNAYLAR
jgi:outer membrane protein